MARKYESAVIITGDAKGAVSAIEMTDEHLQQLNARQDRNRQATKKQSVSWDSLSTTLKGAAAAMGLSVTGLAALGQHQVRAVADTDRMAKSIGVQTSRLQELQYAARSVGLESDQMGDILKDVSDKIGDFVATGGGAAADLFEQLNLDITRLRSMSPDEQLLEIASALDEVGSQGEKVFFLETMGNDLSRMLPLLENNAEGLRRLMREANDLNFSMSQSDIDTMVEANRALDEMWAVTQGLTNSLAVEFAPIISQSVEALRDWIEEMGGMGAVAERFSSALGIAIDVAEVLFSVWLGRKASAIFEKNKDGFKKLGIAGSAAFQLLIGGTGGVNRALLVTQGRIAATTAAARGLAGAMALVGGPAGVALLAASALMQFDTAGQSAEERTRDVKKEVDELTGSLNELSRAALNVKIAEYTGNIISLQADLEMARQKQQAANAEFANTSGVLGGSASAVTKYSQGVQEASAKDSSGLDISQRIDVNRQALESAQDALKNYGKTSQETSANESGSLKKLIGTYDKAHSDLQQLISDRKALTAALAEDPDNEALKRSLAEVNDQIKKATENKNKGAAASKAIKEAEREHAQALKESAETYKRLYGELDPVGRAQAEYQETLSQLRLEVAEGTKTQLEYYAAVSQAAITYNEASGEADEYAQRTQALLEQYDSTYRRSQDLDRAQRDLTKRYKAGQITIGEYQRSMKAIGEESKNLAQDSGGATQVFTSAWDDALDRVDKAFADTMTGLFDGSLDSFGDFADSLKDTFARLLGELSAMAAKNTIMVGLGLDGGGLGGAMGGSGGGGMNLSSLSSLAKKGWDGIQDGFGSVNWTGAGNSAAGGLYSNVSTGAGGLYNNAATGGIQTGGGIWGGSTSNFSGFNGLASAGAGYAGSKIGTSVGSSLFGKQPGSNYGAMAGGAIGTYFGGPVGSFAGSALGGALDSAFGSSRGAPYATIASGTEDSVKSDWAGGLNRTSTFGTFGITGKSQVGGDVLSDMLVSLQSYENELAGLMSGDQIDAVTDRLKGWDFKADGLGEAFEKRYDQLVDGVKGVADKPLKLMLKKVSEIDDRDFEARHEAFSAALQLDSIISEMGGNVADYIKEKIENVSGSGFAARAEQVAADVNKYLAVQSATDQLGLNFDALADGAVYAGRDLVDAAGGIDAFRESTNGYFNNFYTEAEKTERATEQLNNVVGEFGLSADSSREDFRDVAESLDQNSKSGREAFLTLMSVQDSFAQLVPWADKAAESVRKLSAQERADAKSSYVDTFGPIEFKIAETRRELEQAIGSFAKLPTTIEEAREERNRLSRERAYNERAVYESNSGLIKRYIDLLSQQEEQLRTTGDALNRYGMTQSDIDASKGTYINSLAPLGHQISYVRDQLQDAIGGIVDDLPTTIEEAVNQRNRLSSDKRWDERGQYQANSELISRYVGLLDQERSIKVEAARAAREAADAEQERLDALNNRRVDLQIQLLRAQGDEEEALRREREQELAALDATLRPLQKRIWAAQDEAAALEEAAQAQEEYQRKLSSARDSLASFGRSVSQWLDDLNGTAKGLGSPADQLAAASSAYSEQLKLARSGDQDALGSITRYADRFLDAQSQWSGSGMQTQSLIDRLEREIGMLPDQLTPTDLIDDPVAKAISQQTKDLSRVIDTNGDGTISQLELQRAQNEGLLGYSADSVGFGRKQADQLGDVKHDIWEIRQWLTGAGRHDNDYGGQSFVERYDLNRYATGGVFANGIVENPTRFSESLMGEAGPEAIMPLGRGPDGTLGVHVLNPEPLMMGPQQLGNINVSIDQREMLAALRDMESRLVSIERHSEASVRIGQTGFTRMIEGQQTGNRALQTLESGQRLEMSK